jgi:hypothetical protein
MERDQTWAAMYNVAERLTARYCEADTLRVFARRYRRLTVVVEGLLVWDKWTDVFEPVRKRRIFSNRWTEIQPVNEAASKIGAFLQERPDQAEQ